MIADISLLLLPLIGATSQIQNAVVPHVKGPGSRGQWCLDRTPSPGPRRCLCPPRGLDCPPCPNGLDWFRGSCRTGWQLRSIRSNGRWEAGSRKQKPCPFLLSALLYASWLPGLLFAASPAQQGHVYGLLVTSALRTAGEGSGLCAA